MSRWFGAMFGDYRWIPWLFVGFFLVVLAVNGSMMVVAFSTWPGLETQNAYQRGLAYNDTLATARQQAELGWKVDFAFRQDGPRRATLMLDLEDRHGSLIQDASVRVQLVRPTHEGDDRSLDLPHHTGGHYEVAVELPFDGQ
ncbi:MAG: FixH family protein, partial [Pseudomonadota bacterium]